MDLEHRLIEILNGSGIECSAEQAVLLVSYYEMLVEKNKVMNLTAITEFEDVAVKHFADSLSISRIINLTNQSIIDIGTGAGFPGIPLKIMYPELKITLLDSLNKRLLFLDEVIDELKLHDITTLHARAEEAGRSSEYREQFDYAVSRAVANLSTLVEYCLPFVRVGGSFISYKSQKAQDEIAQAGNAISVLGGKLVNQDSFCLSDSDNERTLLKIEKIHSTSSKYPRQGGKPSSDPLH